MNPNSERKTYKSDMDFLTLLLLLSSVLWIIFQQFEPNSLYRRASKLPPGPFPIPIIGNLLQLGQNPNRSLAKLSKIYGPLMHLKLGSKQTIVVSSPEMAKEILQKHDQICSGRAVPCVAQALNHHEGSIVWLPAGRKWRKFRRICKEHMFTTQKLEASEGLRQEKLQQLHNYLEECCSSGRAVSIGEVALVTSLNLMSATLCSMDFASLGSTSAHEMKETIQGVMKILGRPNLADFFPVLKSIDPQGLKHKTEAYGGKLLAMFDEIISERLQSRYTSSDSPRKKDLLEVLLDLNQENDADLSRNDIKHLFVDLVLGGADTSSETVLWAMSELFRNPEKMLKVKDELKNVVTGENKQVEECDIPRLPYLNAVIKEIFRLHPPTPFLIPRKAEANVEVNGYMVPKGAQILVNVWAIGRDSRIWTNPDSFEPQRFLDSTIDFRGQDFELITFGSGRRICPGIPLAHLMVHLMLASMVHNFEWKLEPGIKPEELDMNEVFGLTLHKAVPLKAFPIRQ
uniref:Cytochrome P450 76S80 n=1 Tax=Callicarpa americana TaxID=204211 RepID=A0A9Y1PSY1_CALAM|nr:cytochrome P450 76S80 [Callicarpa americana]